MPERGRERLIKAVFLVIPMFFILNAAVMHRNMGPFFMGSVDPEYFYLYNGTIIGGGTLSVEYTAHPGTPLMFLIGMSNRTISFFQPGGYMADVVDNPENYIFTASLFLIGLIGIALFIAGVYTRKYTGSILAGLLVQLALPGSASLMHISGRLIPEALMIVPMLLVSLMVIRRTFLAKEQSSGYKEMIAFAVIIGFGIACKLSFVPVIVIPLILLKSSVRQKLKFLLYTFIAFAVFAYPVIFNFDDFWQWIAGLFTHSGKYGTGGQGFINPESIPANLLLLFDNDRPFFYIMIFSLMVALLLSIKSFSLNNNLRLPVIRSILAINAALVLAVAFTLKHFEVYYFIPFYVFKFVLVLLTLFLLTSLEPLRRRVRIPIVALVISGVLIILFFQTEKAVGINDHYSSRGRDMERRYALFNQMYEKGSPLILAGHYSGAPFIEFAHYNGFQMSFNRKGFFDDYLRKKFPHAYLFVSWSDRLYYWNELVDYEDMLREPVNTVFVYSGEGMKEELKMIEERIRSSSDNAKLVRETVCMDEKTGEQLIRYKKIPHQHDL